MSPDVYEIEELTKEQLLNTNFIPSIFENYQDEEERNEIIKEILIVAKKRRVVTKVSKAISDYKKSEMLDSISEEAIIAMTITGDKKEDITIENFHQAIINTPEIADYIRFNEFTNRFENVKRPIFARNWNDSDNAWVMNILEQKYKLYDKNKYEIGLMLCKEHFKYHPIKEKIESINWDGKSRIDTFLSDIMKCEQDDYSREVSRMIFYGGINRLYYPGCKFDYMPILVGEQGTCKSTIVDWLTMDTGGFKTIDTIDNKDAKDILRYTWIGEFSELLAFVKTRMAESIKAFISTQVDMFRNTYGKEQNDWARHCIFIGTTNNYEFLVDKTGNRRFLPIEVHAEKGDLYVHEKEVKYYIEQCWAEAKYLMDNGKTYLVVPQEYLSTVEERQKMFMEEDPQENKVADYLRKKEVGYRICVAEIWQQALHGLDKNCSRVQSNLIASYMRSHKNWVKGKNCTTFKDYPKARYWEKIKEDED